MESRSGKSKLESSRRLNRYSTKAITTIKEHSVFNEMFVLIFAQSSHHRVYDGLDSVLRKSRVSERARLHNASCPYWSKRSKLHNCAARVHQRSCIAKRIDVTLALPQTIHQRDPTVHFEAGSFVCRTTGSTNWAILQPAGGGFPPPPPPPFPSVMLRTSTTYAILDAIICTITPVRRISFARVKSKFRISMQKWNKFFFEIKS